MIPWEEIENHNDFKVLKPEQQSALKGQWFTDNIASSQEFNSLNPDRQNSIRKNFLGGTQKTELRRIDEPLEPVAVSDYPKLLASGVGRLAKTIGAGQKWVSPGQMFARGLEAIGDITDTPTLKEAGEFIKERLPSSRLQKLGKETSEHWQEKLSHGMKQRQALPYLAGKDEAGIFGEGIKSGHKILGELVQSAPETAIGMFGGAGATKLIQNAIPGLSKTTAGIIGGMIGEGLTAGGGGAVDAYDKINNTPKTDLEKTGIYKKIHNALPDFIPDKLKDKYARKILALSASGFVGTTISALTGLFGAPSGAAMGKIIGGEAGKNIWSTALKQAFLEGVVQEFPQSASEQFIDNFATKVLVDPKQDLWEGVGEAAVGGGIAGALMGAGMAPAYRGMADKPLTYKQIEERDRAIIDSINEGVKKSLASGEVTLGQAVKALNESETPELHQAISKPLVTEISARLQAITNPSELTPIYSAINSIADPELKTHLTEIYEETKKRFIDDLSTGKKEAETHAEETTQGVEPESEEVGTVGEEEAGVHIRDTEQAEEETEAGTIGEDKLPDTRTLWGKTPAFVADTIGLAEINMENLTASSDARIKAIKEELKSLKGVTGKANVARRKELNAELNNLKATPTATRKAYANHNEGKISDLVVSAIQRAKRAGVPNDYKVLDKFKIDFEKAIQANVQENYDKPITQIFNEVVAKYVKQPEKTAPEKSETELAKERAEGIAQSEKQRIAGKEALLKSKQFGIPEKPVEEVEAGKKEEGGAVEKELFRMTRDDVVWGEFVKADGSSTGRALKGRLSRWERIQKEATAEGTNIEAVEKAIKDEKARIKRAEAHKEAVQKALIEGKLSVEDYNKLHAKDYGSIEAAFPDIAMPPVSGKEVEGKQPETTPESAPQTPPEKPPEPPESKVEGEAIGEVGEEAEGVKKPAPVSGSEQEAVAKEPAKPVAKEPWENSELAQTPNIPIDLIEAKKQSNKLYKLFYRGTNNEVFYGEEFKTAPEARAFFKVQQLKAQKANKEPAEAKPPTKKPISPPAEKASKPETKPQAIGTAWVNNSWRPIKAYRQITKGKNKGKYNITLANNTHKIVDKIKLDEEGKEADVVDNEIIATQIQNNIKYEYRIGMVPKEEREESPQLKYRVEIRREGDAEWESAYYGKQISREKALDIFSEKVTKEPGEFNVIDENVKAKYEAYLAEKEKAEKDRIEKEKIDQQRAKEYWVKRDEYEAKVKSVPLKGKKGTFEISTDQGKKEVNGTIYKNQQGIGIGLYKNDKGKFTVTHMPTGFSIGYFETLASAKFAIKAYILHNANLNFKDVNKASSKDVDILKDITRFVMGVSDEIPAYSEDAPTYSLTQDTGITPPAKPVLTTKDVDGIVAQVRKYLPNIGNITAVQSKTDIPADIHKRAGLTDKQVQESSMSAVYDPRTDTTYIVADSMTGVESTLRSILHETIGHRGVTAVLNDKQRVYVYRNILASYRNSDIGKRIVGDYELDLKKDADKDTFAKELIAHMAQTGENATLLDRIITWVRNAFRKAGFDLKMTDTEVKSLIAKGYRYAEGKGNKQSAQAKPAYQLNPDAEAIAKANNAHYDGIWKDAKGKPYAFTDNVTKSSIIVYDLKDLPFKLEAMRKKFGKAETGERPTYSLAGRKAKGAPISQVSKAQEMLDQNKTDDEIWKSTGWMKGIEGKWMFRIDDSDAEVMTDKLHSVEGSKELYTIDDLAGLLKHPELFKAYPQLKNIMTSIEVEETAKSNSGEYISGMDREAEGLFDLEPEIRITATSAESIKSTLLHEIQHAIQNIEGFARGGSPALFTTGGKEKYRKLAGEIFAREAGSEFKGTPGTMEGIPRNEWIIRRGKGTNFSVEPKEAERPSYSIESNEDRINREVEEHINRAEPEDRDKVRKDMEHAIEAFNIDFPKEVVDTARSFKKYLNNPMKKGKGWKPKKQDTSKLARIFGSIEFYSEPVPPLHRAVTPALNYQDTIQTKVNHLVKDEEGKSLLKVMGDFYKADRKEYNKLNKFLVNCDRNKVDYTIQDAGEYKVDVELLKKKGFSDQAIETTKAFRRILDKGFDMYFAEMLQVIEECERLGKPLPTIAHINEEGNEVEIDLREALREVEKMRGYYFPRKWVRGKYMIKGRKADGVGGKLEFAGSVASANKVAKRLRKEGYIVDYDKDPLTGIQESKDQPNDVFELYGQTIAADTLVNSALAMAEEKHKESLADYGIKLVPKTHTAKSGKATEYITIAGTGDSKYGDTFKKIGGRYFDIDGAGKTWNFNATEAEVNESVLKALSAQDEAKINTTLAFAESLAMNIAHLIRTHGHRAHMERRSPAVGEGVTVGYEEDLVKATVQYANGLATGQAKKEMVGAMVLAGLGRDISWNDYRDNSKGHRTQEQIKASPKASYKEYQEFVKDRRIDPIEQKEAFHEWKVFTQDMARNEDPADRVINMIKTASVVKFLAYRVFSPPLINLTALATSVPASMHTYAKIPFHKVPVLLGKAIKDYGKYRLNRSKIDSELRDVFDEIERRGWHAAQFNEETLAYLQTRTQGAIRRFVEMGMAIFGATEQLNRASTIAAAYFGIKGNKKFKYKDKDGNFTQEFEDALQLAHYTSDKSHGMYHKATLPYLARGNNLGAQSVKSFYVFSKYSHTYLQNMVQMGFKEKDMKSVAWMLASPAVLAGATGSVAWSAIMPVLSAVFGWDDPEDAMYEWVEENLGSTTAGIVEHGLMGELGLNVKGSLGIGFKPPMTIADCLGAPGSLFVDLKEAFGHTWRGEYLKGAEKVMPLAVGGMFKAYREKTEGVSTYRYGPVFYGNEPLKATTPDAVLRFMSFNPARIADIKNKQWRERKVDAKYRDLRTRINSRIKKYYMQSPQDRTVEEWIDILEDIQVFNERIRRKGLTGILNPITQKSIETLLKRAFKPNKRERMRE